MKKISSLFWLTLVFLWLLLALAVNSRAAAPILGYFGGDPTPGTDATYRSFVSAVGQQAGAIDTYIPYDQGPAGWLNGANYSAGVISDFNGRNGTSMVPVVGLPMATDKSTAMSDFQTIASGGADGALKGIFDAYAAKGFKSIVLRPGWEMNGDWYPWSVTSDNAAAFTAAFQRIAEVSHSYAGMTVSVDWNPGYVNGSTPYMSYFPGAQYVDSIGIDTYGQGSGVPSDAPLDASTNPNTYTLKDAIALAKSTGKPLALPETGAGPGDTTFPALLAQVISESGVPVSFINLWDDTNGGLGNLQWSYDANSAQAWRAAVATLLGNPGAGVLAGPASGVVPPVGSISATPQQRTATAGAFNQAPGTTAQSNPSAGLPVDNAASAKVQPTSSAKSCPANPTGGILPFHSVNGALLDPAGNPFLPRGINLSDTEMGAAPAILSTYPGINLVRLNVSTYQAPGAYAGFIGTMTAHHTVVVLENHQSADATTKGLQQEIGWYSAAAKAYAGNPLVWFGTGDQQPTSADAASKRQVATYQAIRGAGNNNPILVEVVGGQVATSYAAMTNIIWDVHFFVGDPPANTPDQSAALTAAVAAAQAVAGADGVVPVVIGAFGPVGAAMAGAEAVINSKVVGGAAWAWSTLVNGGAVTDPWGTSVQLWVNTDVVPPTDCQANATASADLAALTASLAATPTPVGPATATAEPANDNDNDNATTAQPPSADDSDAASDIANATKRAKEAVAARRASQQ